MRRLKPFLALLHKEWRDTRALTIACALLVPVAILAMNFGYLDWRGDVGAWFVPLVVALYLVVVAADLIASDVSSGRARSYAALPVGASSLWGAKMTFLVLAAVAFTTWTVAVTTGLYAAFAPSDAADLLGAEITRISLWTIGGCVAVVVSVVFWSGVLERGLAAVGAGIVTCALLGGAVPLLAWIDVELLPEQDTLLRMLFALPVLFLAGSLVGFVRGPHHAASLLRRLALTLAVPLVVLVPAGAVSAAVLLERLDVEIGDEGVRVAAGHLSPDGRYLVLLAQKRHRGARVHTFVLDTEEGDVVRLPQRGLQADWDRVWTADGHYLAWCDSDGDRHRDLRREYDPETGAVIRTRSLEQLSATGMWTPPPFGAPWASVERDGDDTVVTLDATGVAHRVPRRRAPYLSRVPGYFLERTAGEIRLHDLNADRVITLVEGDNASFGSFSPGGEYAHAYRDGQQEIYATRTGERVIVPDGWGVGWPGGSSDDHVALGYERERGMALVDLRTSTVHALDPNPDTASGGWADVRILPGGDRVLRVRRDGQVIAHDLDGGHRKTLFDPRRRSE